MNTSRRHLGSDVFVLYPERFLLFILKLTLECLSEDIFSLESRDLKFCCMEF